MELAGREARAATSAPALSNGLKRTIAIVVGMTVALCGADRIDLLAGKGFVTLTPSLPMYGLAIVCLFVLWIRLRPRVRMTRWLWWGSAFVAGLVIVAALSLAASGFPALGVRRLALLGLTVCGVVAAVVLARWLGLGRAVRLGAWAGLLLALALTVLQVIMWSPAAAGISHWAGPIYVTSPSYGPVAPRPAGSSIDPNRGAFAAALFLYLLAADPWTRNRGKPRLEWAALLLSAAVAIPTLSRTGLASWVIVVVAVLIVMGRCYGARRVLIPVASGVTAILVAAVIILVLSNLDWMRLLRERFSLSSDDSGGLHLELIQLGFDVLNQESSRWISGVGFGMSPDVIGEFFGGRHTGNFHSFYLTFLVETGLAGLFIALALTIVPLFCSRYHALALAVVVFNVLYQAHLDGAFWLAIAAIWFLPERCLSHPGRISTEKAEVNVES